MTHTESFGAASFFEYRAAVAHDFQQFYLTLKKRINRSIKNVKSSYADITSFSGFNCLSDDEPVKMTITQMAKAQIERIPHNLLLRYKRHAEIRALRDLSGLSDSTLKDIGFTRGDIEYVKRLPLAMSPAEELNKINQQQHRRLA